MFARGLAPSYFALSSFQSRQATALSHWWKWEKLVQMRSLHLSSRGHQLATAFVNRMPRQWQPYLRLMRVDKPTGTLLLYWPCTWSIALCATPGCFPDLKLLALFGIGSFLMRGASCIVNDLWDKEFDKKVARTKSRPLASGEVSTLQAFGLLGGLLTGSLAVLLQLNDSSVLLGICSLPLVATYPLFKRFTFWPQLALGVTFNWGVLLGWAAVCGTVDWFCVLPAYAGSICWTIVYDTIYAHQDKSDDLAIGVKSTAIKFGNRTKTYLAGFGSLMTGCLLVTGAICDQTWPYYLGVALAAAQLSWQIITVNIDSPDDCWKKFSSNRYAGFVLFGGIVLSNLLKY
ncbi:4 hydroxybenzoate polyprenyltransferase [Trichuris trichiura]|uniref:4-hydroxybenzoate polyprenyltransferase, mitochondrial n=1 Tax=Trichuris trichiura TaxID=36087 RepID=A0A077ZDU3_TRITR|nr:4 hydroxybenzoate polyprenyltransferase [Trichuris trichiura]